MPAVDHERREESEAATERGRRELLRQRDPATGRIPANARADERVFSATLPSWETGAFAKGSSVSSGFNFNWRQRGPYNVGGRTRALAIDANDENTILAGGVSGGLWRSSDAGTNWTRSTALDQLPSVTCIAQDRRQGKRNVWYYGTGELLGNSASGDGYGADFIGDGIFKSTDEGRHWSLLQRTVSNTPQTFNSPFQYVWDIVIGPSSATDDILYAATYGGIMRSSDGGGDWSVSLGGMSNDAAATDVAITSTGVLYATLNSEGSSRRDIFRSINGIDWKDITPANFPSTYYRMVIAVAPSNEDVLYMLAETPGRGKTSSTDPGAAEWHSLWKYTCLGSDGSGSGGQWVDLSNNLPEPTNDFDGFASYEGYALMVNVKPDDENTVLIGGTNL